MAETGNIIKLLCKIRDDKTLGKYMGKIETTNYFMRTIHRLLMAAAVLLVFCSASSAQEARPFKVHEISVGVAPGEEYCFLPLR